MVNYPASIDNGVSVPAAVDSATTVSASVVNRLRDAILAVQTELGVKPSGVYTNVKTRLGTLEETVGSLQIITLAGDLGGTLSVPLVTGLQGRAVSPSAPSSGQSLAWNGIVWAPATISADSSTLPSGNNTYIQFNDSGVFGGDAGLTYNKTTNLLSLSDAIALGALPATAGNIRLSGSHIVNANSFDNSHNTTIFSKDTATGADYLFIGFNGSGGGYNTPMNSIVMGADSNLFFSIAGNTELTLTSTLSAFVQPISIGTGSAHTTAKIRFPYATQTLIGVKDSTNIDRSVISHGGGDQFTVGDVTQGLNINGSSIVHSTTSTHSFLISGITSATIGSEYLSIGQNAATTGDCLRLGPSVANAGVYNNVITTKINGANAEILRIHDGASFLQFSDPNYYTTLRGYSNTYASNSAGVHEFDIGVSPVLTLSSTTATIGTINTIQNGNANGLVTDVIRSLHTTDATVTDIYNWVIRSGAVSIVDALITAISDNGTVGGSYKRTVTFRENGGVNLIGTIHDNQTDEDAAAWDVTIDTDGAGNGRIRVTGDVALGVTWYVSGRVQHVILTP